MMDDAILIFVGEHVRDERESEPKRGPQKEKERRTGLDTERER